jgi:hypothetical protein
MAKWINIATGLEVPSTSVRELVPGSGLFVHETTYVATKLEVTRERTGVQIETYPNTTIRTVDGYAVRLEDTETFDPNVDYIGAQVLASQAAIRARGGV